MLKYMVYVEDDMFEFISNHRLNTEQVADKLNVPIDLIVMIDFEDAD